MNRLFGLATAALILLVTGPAKADRISGPGDSGGGQGGGCSGYFPNGTPLTINGSKKHAQNANRPWNLQQSDTYNVQCFETRPGDQWVGDAGRHPITRSEVTADTGEAAVNTTNWVYYAFRVTTPNGENQGGGVYGQLHQHRTDKVRSSPIISIQLNSAGQVRVKHSYGLEDPLVKPVDVIDYAGSSVVYGQTVNVLIKYKVMQTVHHGSLEVWIDGAKAVNLSDVDLGYLNDGAPYWKHGIYRTDTPVTTHVDYFNWTGPTTADLSGYIAGPPAIPAPFRTAQSGDAGSRCDPGRYGDGRRFPRGRPSSECQDVDRDRTRDGYGEPRSNQRRYDDRGGERQ